MSMENAILELAAAIRELAGSGQRITGMPAAIAALYGEQAQAIGKAAAKDIAQAVTAGDPEIEQAVEKVEAAAKEEKKAERAPDAAPKTEQPAAATLDYKADVYPKLVGLAKAKGKPALVGLLKEFDAANGEALKPEQYAQVVARAAELAA